MKTTETWWQRFVRKQIKGITYWDELPPERRLNIDFTRNPKTGDISILFRNKDDSGWDELTINDLRALKKEKERKVKQ